MVCDFVSFARMVTVLHFQFELSPTCKQLLSSQELEVLSFNHPYSLKTKSSLCHYVVMTRSETKFQAPLNRCYQEVLAKIEHVIIKFMSTGHARHG